MAYYHRGCEGRVKWYPFLPIAPKCSKCGQKWPIRSTYSTRPPADMYYHFTGPSLHIEKGDTDYASWADSNKAPPGVALIASHLPNWPRKWRLVSFLSTLIILSGGFYGLYLLSFWAVVAGAIILAASPVGIMALLSKRRKLP